MSDGMLIRCKKAATPTDSKSAIASSTHLTSPRVRDSQPATAPHLATTGTSIIIQNKEDENEQHETPDIPTQLERAKRFGHNLSQVKVGNSSARLPSPAYPIAPKMIQCRLTIGQTGDKYEQEADRVAQQVIRRMAQPINRQPVQDQQMQEEELQMKPLANSITPVVQRQEVPEEEKELQMKSLADNSLVQCQQEPQEEEELQTQSMVQRRPAGGGISATSDLETSIQQVRGGGRPLADEIQQPMEQAFGADFSSVRVHTDAHSDQLNKSIQARAFTTGQDIFFRQGEYSPGSDVGKELLAHELTHVVQQNGNAVQRKTERSVNAAKQRSYSPNIEKVVSQPSQDISIQRLCSECEKEQQLSIQERAEETLQAKELAGYTINVNSDLAASSHPSLQTKEQIAAESLEQEALSERFESASANISGGEPSPPPATGGTEPPNDPQERPENIENALADRETKTETSDAQSVEIAGTEDKSPVNADDEANATVDQAAEQQGEEKENIPASQAVDRASGAGEPAPNQNAQDKGKASPNGKAAEGQGEERENLRSSQAVDKAAGAGEQAPNLDAKDTAKVASSEIGDKAAEQQGEERENLPGSQAIDKASGAGEQAPNLNAEDMGKAASPETVAEQEQAIATVAETQAQQNTVNTETTQLVSTGINFAPAQQQTSDRDANNAEFFEQQGVEASNISNDFLATAASRVQTITQLGPGISARIQASAENAKASVMAAVEQQKAAVTAQIAQQRDQAQSEAQAIIAQIQAQYQVAVVATSQTTATGRQKVEAEYTTSLQKVAESENNQLARIEEFYTQAKEKYRAAGVKVGDEAIAFGEQKATGWESQIKGEDDNLWDGPLTDNRLKARAKAAREVAKQYKDGLIQEANKQADAVSQGKPKDIEAIHNVANQSREQLQTLQKQSLDNLNAVEQQVLSQLAEAQTQLNQTANQTLQATLQSLDQQEAAQLQLLEAYGQRQGSAIERDAQKAIASLQDGINQAAANLQTVLQDTQNQLQGMEAPNPEELSAVLADILGQFDNAVAQVQEQTEKGIAASEQGITEGGQQAVAGISAIAQTGLQESAAVSQEAKTTLTNLNQGATNTFSQIQQAFTTTVTKTSETAVTGFGQTTQGVQTAFDRVNQNLDSNFQKSVNDLEEGLRGALHGSKQPNLESDIQKYADEAAAKEEPRWKTVLKVLLVVAVIVVAIVVAPAVIGAVGAVAGALGASAAAAGAIGAVVGGAIVGAVAGAVIQIGNNAIDGKNLLDGVGKAALVGAIGGALGGAGGVLGNALGQAGKLGAGLTQSVLKFGIDVAFDIAGSIAGDLAVGNPITVEGILIGAGIGAAVQISTANLGKLGKFGRKVEGMQTRTFQAGEQFGSSLGNRVKSGFGGKVDTAIGSPDVGVTGVKSPETGVRSSQTEVTDPQSQVKSPTAETSTGRDTQIDQPEAQTGAVPKDPTTETAKPPSAKSQGEQEQNLAATEKNQDFVRIIRQDNDFASLFNHKGKTKSHVAEDGSLVPANPNGKATPLEHVYGSDPAKGDSPYTSFLTESGGVAKTYGTFEIELDLPRLQADIASGHLKNVEVLTPEQISGMIKDEIAQLATNVKKDIDIDAAIANGPQGIPDYVASLAISKGQSSKLGRRLLAYFNTTRDGEYLIKGTVPATYLKGPYSAKAGEQPGTSGGGVKSGSSGGVDTPTASRPDGDTGTSHVLKPDSDLPMTPKQQEVLKNTAPKKGSELTSEELNTELELAGKAKSRSIDEGEFVEEIKLPNDHEWKQKEDGTWCRFSGEGHCMPGVEPTGNSSNGPRTRARTKTDQKPRATLTLDKLVENLKKFGEPDERWTEEYEPYLKDMKQEIEQKQKGEEPIEKTEEEWIVYIQEISINKGNDTYSQIIRYLRFETDKSPGSSGGLGTLSINGEKIEGRPMFSGTTQKYLQLPPKQARRHISAWHTLKDFINKGYAALKGDLIVLLKENLDRVAPPEIVKEVEDFIAKKPKAFYGKLNPDDAKVLMTALYVMNSNPKNLWVGAASENSNINIASQKINDKVMKANTIEELATIAREWKTPSGKSKEINTAKEVAADIILKKDEQIYEQLNNVDPERHEQVKADGVEQVKAEIQEMRGTLEIDVITGNKDKTENIFKERSKILEAAKTLYEIQEGLTDIESIKGDLSGIIKTMMQYPDNYIQKPKLAAEGDNAESPTEEKTRKRSREEDNAESPTEKRQRLGARDSDDSMLID